MERLGTQKTTRKGDAIGKNGGVGYHMTVGGINVWIRKINPRL